MATLVVAAVSARLLAETAARDGHRVIALDLYGDADTRAACQQWLPLGKPDTLHIDADRLLPALDAAAATGDVLGWIPGTGFEGQPELLAQGAQRLPLIGNHADTVRRTRDPHCFFGLLEQHGVLHPAWQPAPPATHDATGWLRKDAREAGGRHTRHRAPGCDDCAGNTAPVDPQVYFQREMHGTPLSATYIANGHRACVLGINALMSQPWDAWPHVYRGVIGPVPVPACVTQQITQALEALVPALGLRGLGSLDVLWDGSCVWVLEINPRPPASMALYATQRFRADADGAHHGILEAHLQACLQGRLPVPAEVPADSASAMRGTEIVYADRPLQLTTAQAASLAHQPDAHDVPARSMQVARGDPLCSVSAVGDSLQEVQRRLRDTRAALLHTLDL